MVGVLHGALVLHAKSGAVLFAQRNEPAFGLTACEHVAKDEMRLGAMLFALHLNAASCGAESLDNAETSQAETRSNGLDSYRIGDVILHFRSGLANPILLVLFTHESMCMTAAAYLSTEVMRHLENCASFDVTMHAGMAPTPRHAKRQAFTAALHDSLHTLRTWLFERLQDGMQAAVRLDGLEIAGLGALCSRELCASLESETPHAAASPTATTAPDSPPRGRAARSSSTQPPSWTSHEPGLPTAVSPSADERADSPAWPPKRRGCFAWCRRARGPTARRPAPHPPSVRAAAAAMPQLFWHQPSAAALDAEAGHLATVADDARFARLVRDMRAAWHHRSLPGPCALYSPPNPIGLVAHGGPPIGTSPGPTKAVQGSAERTARREEFALFLIRAPLLLYARVVLRAAGAPHYEPALTQAASCARNELRIQQAIWAAAAAVQPWESALLLCQATIQTASDRERNRGRPAAREP